MASALYDTIKGLAKKGGFSLNNRSHNGASFGSEVAEAATRLKTYAINQLAELNSFLSIMSCSDWMVNDASVGGTNVEIDTAILDDQVKAMAYATATSIRDFLMAYGDVTQTFHRYVYRHFLTTSDGNIVCLTFINPGAVQIPYTYSISYTTYTVSGSDGTLSNPVEHAILKWNDNQDVKCFTNVIGDINGNFINLWDLVSGMLQNQQLLQLSMKVSDFVLSNESEKSNVIEILPLISEFLNSQYQEIREFVNQLTLIFRNEGLYSCFLYLLNIVQYQTTAAYDEENVSFSFTDNKSIVPKAYTNGWFNAISGTLAAGAAIIATAGQWVLGALVGVISAGLHVIGKILDVDPSITRGMIIHYGRSLTDAFPVALGQKKLNSNEASLFADIHDENATYAEKVAVPGGYLYIGQNEQKEWISEFHPDIHDRRQYLNEFATFVDTEDDSLVEIAYSDFNNFITRCGKYNDDNMSEICINSDDGHMTQSGDDEIMKIGYFNTALFLIWCTFTMRKGYTGYSGDVLVLRCDGHEDNKLYASMKYGSTGTTAEIWLDDINNRGPFTFLVSIYNEAFLQNLVSLDPEYYHNKLIYSTNGQHETWDMFTQLFSLSASATLGHTVIGGFDILTPANSMYSVKALIDDGLYYNGFMACDSRITWAVKIPSVSAASYWAFVNLSILLSTVTIITTVIVAVSIRKILNKQRLKNNLAVEQAYNNAVENPTEDNIKAYNKTRFKANLFAKIFGGTTYSKTGYWVDSSNSETSARTAASFIAQRATTLIDEPSTGDASISDVLKLIRG